MENQTVQELVERREDLEKAYTKKFSLKEVDQSKFSYSFSNGLDFIDGVMLGLKVPIREARNILTLDSVIQEIEERQELEKSYVRLTVEQIQVLHWLQSKVMVSTVEEAENALNFNKWLEKVTNEINEVFNELKEVSAKLETMGSETEV